MGISKESFEMNLDRLSAVPYDCRSIFGNKFLVFWKEEKKRVIKRR